MFPAWFRSVSGSRRRISGRFASVLPPVVIWLTVSRPDPGLRRSDCLRIRKNLTETAFSGPSQGLENTRIPADFVPFQKSKKSDFSPVFEKKSSLYPEGEKTADGGLFVGKAVKIFRPLPLERLISKGLKGFQKDPEF